MVQLINIFITGDYMHVKERDIFIKKKSKSKKLLTVTFFMMILLFIYFFIQ
jgi:hypothetical protein